MQRLVEWIDRHWTITWISTCAVSALTAWLLFYGVGIHASPAAKYQPPGCSQFGIVGTVQIAHCVTESGFEFIANSAGMLIPAGN